MLRIHVGRLLRARAEAERRVIPLREVSVATGISVAVLSKISSPRGGATTNTRYVESLCRYFNVPPSELLELQPPLDAGVSCHVDALYPGTAQAPEAPTPTAAKSTPKAAGATSRGKRAKGS